MTYSYDLLDDANRLRFPPLVEREFQEAHYNVKAHQFISEWGLIPAFVILCAFWCGDYVGFTQHLEIITCIRIASLLPLAGMIALRKSRFMLQYIRPISSIYLFYLACTVLAIVAITPHTDFAHRGYTMSFPMVIFTMFLAKPHMRTGLLISTLFILIFNAVNILFTTMPLGHNQLISHVHLNLVLVSSAIIGAVTCYVLEAAERREFIRKKISEQDRELILLQQLELEDAVAEQIRLNSTLNEQNTALSELNTEKNEFLGIVAHDLKNPLAGITMQTGMLKRYVQRLSPHEISSIANTIETVAHRMKDIVVTLLDVNAIETGRVVPVPENFHMSELLQQVCQEFSHRATAKDIVLETDIDRDLYCFADASISHQVIDNVLSNAIKFSPKGSSVLIRARATTTALQIDICDQGPGLTEEDKKNLFKKYQRLSAKPTDGEHSTGLGLSIVLRLVEMMNGKIWCESVAGHGATFSVSLPTGARCGNPVVAQQKTHYQHE